MVTADLPGLVKMLQSERPRKKALNKALLLAVNREFYDMSNVLLSAGGSPAAGNKSGHNMIHRCADIGNSKVLNLLLSKAWKARKSDVEFAKMINQKCKHDEHTPLFVAVEKRHNACIEVLLRHGANVNCLCSVLQEPALFKALHEDWIDIAKLLIDYGTDPCIRDISGRGVFSYAEKLKKSILELYNEMSQKHPGKKEILTQVALYDALKTGKLDIVSTLVDNGAKLDHVDQFDRTPLSYIIDRWQNGFYKEKGVQLDEYSFVKYILENGGAVHINRMEDLGFVKRPLFMHAAKNLELLKLMEKYSADMESTDSHGNTLLHYAVDSQQINIVEYLLQTGKCDVNALGQFQQSALLRACRWFTTNTIELVKVLLKNGAKADCNVLGVLASQLPDDGGYIKLDSTIPLFEVFKLILRSGCDINGNCSLRFFTENCQFEGTSTLKQQCLQPLQIAVCHGNVCLMQMLDVAGANLNSVSDFRSKGIKWASSPDFEVTIAEKIKTETLDALEELNTETKSLQMICRSKIRSILGQKCDKKIAQIDSLPKLLLNYLNMPELEVIQEKHTANIKCFYAQYREFLDYSDTDDDDDDMFDNDELFDPELLAASVALMAGLVTDSDNYSSDPDFQ